MSATVNPYRSAVTASCGGMSLAQLDKVVKDEANSPTGWAGRVGLASATALVAIAAPVSMPVTIIGAAVGATLGWLAADKIAEHAIAGKCKAATQNYDSWEATESGK